MSPNFLFSRRPLLSEETVEAVAATTCKDNLTNCAYASPPKKVYHFFEGAEKLLEIWFTDNGNYPNASLRSIDRCAMRLSAC